MRDLPSVIVDPSLDLGICQQVLRDGLAQIPVSLPPR